MPFMIVLSWAVFASAQRLTPPRLVARAAPIPALAAAVPSLSLLRAPALAAPSAAPAPAPETPPAADGLPGRSAQALAALPPDHRDWDREVFEAMFSGRYKGPKPWTEVEGVPKVLVGSMVVDKRAPGARELLKTLVLPDERPVLGLFLRDGDRVVNGVAMGTHGVWGHRDAAPPGASVKTHGGYALRLARDGALRLVASGSYPAEITPRLLRALSRYYGLSPLGESAWGRFKRGLWGVWDALSFLVKS